MDSTPKAPRGLAARGRRLWLEMLGRPMFDPNPAELALLEEACRMADRLERLDAIIRGESTELVKVLTGVDGEPVRLAVDGVLAEARQQQNVFKQLLTALRVPDEAGKRPQHRGARGAYQPRGTGSVSSLDRARQAVGG